MRVAVAARSSGQVEETAREIDGVAVTADVSKQEDVEAMVATVERELGPIDLLVNNAGVGPSPDAALGGGPGGLVARVRDQRARRLPVQPRGAAGDGRARSRSHRQHRQRRFIPAPGRRPTSYGASKAALGRFGELLAGQVAELGVSVFVISPGLVRTEMTDAVRRRRTVDAARARAPTRPRARERTRGPPRRPLHPRRARRHRRADRARRRDRAARPERDPTPALSLGRA